MSSFFEDDLLVNTKEVLISDKILEIESEEFKKKYDPTPRKDGGLNHEQSELYNKIVNQYRNWNFENQNANEQEICFIYA